MITILFITFCFYLVAELIKQGTAAKARKREAARQARIEAEMRRDREERERVAREQREQREALLSHEKALREMHLAQLREEKQRLKMEAEQAKQNEQIRKLQQKSEQADIDIGFLLDQYNKYNEIGEYLERERDACVPGSTNWQKWNKKVLTNDAKVHRLNKQLNMAINTRDEAMIKMREVTA